MKFNFMSGAWDKDLLVSANCYRWQEVPSFVQEEDALVNRRNPSCETGYENASLMLKTPLCGNYHLEAVCSFDAWGAPLIVIAEDLSEDENGLLRYREYYEVVLYENGINVWRLRTDKNDHVTWKKLMSVDFPVTPKEKHTLSVDVLADSLEITADGKKMSLFLFERFPSYFVGIDACENVNRFYSFKADPMEDSEAPKLACSVCGFTCREDSLPDRCPDCGVGKEKFVSLA